MQLHDFGKVDAWLEEIWSWMIQFKDAVHGIILGVGIELSNPLNIFDLFFFQLWSMSFIYFIISGSLLEIFPICINSKFDKFFFYNIYVSAAL